MSFKKDSAIKNVVLTAFLLFFCGIMEMASAEVVVNIGKGVMKPISIALNIFDSANSSLKFQIDKVITNDLQGTCLFRAIPEKAFMQNLNGINVVPKFQLWKTINAQYLVNTEVRSQGGQVTLEFFLYDVLSELQVGRFSATGAASDWRKIAHLAANSIYERITGEKGYFNTKFLYVALNRSPKGGKIYRLAMMDQDGFNHKYLTNGNSIVLTPRLAPNGSECAYFTYREKIVNGRKIPTSASDKIFLLSNKVEASTIFLCQSPL